MDPQLWIPGGAGLAAATTFSLHALLKGRKNEPRGGRPLGLFLVLLVMGASREEARKLVMEIIAKRNGVRAPVQRSVPPPRNIRPIEAAPSPQPPDDEPRASPSG